MRQENQPGRLKAAVRAARETAARLAFAAPPQAPPPELKARLWDRLGGEAEAGPQVWKSWPAEAPAALHIVRAGEGDWQTIGLAGIVVKKLYSDPERDSVTMLVRMEPGAEYPAHQHGGPEQCLVLEGDLEVGDLVLQAGDFQCAAAASIHSVSRTRAGCLLLIVSSQHDRLLA
jgi:anti-sigma factor ChrR (cupin superfamily)